MERDGKGKLDAGKNFDIHKQFILSVYPANIGIAFPFKTQLQHIGAI